MRGHVIVLGSYLVGLVMEVDRLPGTGETLMGRNYRKVHGGKGSNMAVQAARLGAHVEFTAVLGADQEGDAILADLRREGVGVDFVRRSRHAPTGAGFIVVDRQGRNFIVIDAGANAGFAPGAELDRCFETGGAAGVALAQCEIPVPAALAGLSMARRRGWRTVLNPAPAVDLSRFDLSHVDYLTPNETEARVCLGFAPEAAIDEEELAAGLLARGVGAVVFTRGEKGARLHARDRVLEVPALPVIARDTVGAGDSFNAAFATALAEDMGEIEALRFACAAASLSTTRPDTIPSYHTRDEVNRALLNSSLTPDKRAP